MEFQEKRSNVCDREETKSMMFKHWGLFSHSLGCLQKEGPQGPGHVWVTTVDVVRMAWVSCCAEDIWKGSDGSRMSGWWSLGHWWGVLEIVLHQYIYVLFEGQLLEATREMTVFINIPSSLQLGLSAPWLHLQWHVHPHLHPPALHIHLWLWGNWAHNLQDRHELAYMGHVFQGWAPRGKERVFAVRVLSPPSTLCVLCFFFSSFTRQLPSAIR